ncbi:MAG: glycosyltransferase [Planctomycetes bacterium B3_Pla]|nr:MAG: glycosyltransferase [Planctomycetes bacterium B3_Pla]
MLPDRSKKSFQKTRMLGQDSNGTGTRIHIGGAPVDSISLSSLLPYLDGLVEDGNPHYVCFCEAHLSVRATFEKEIRYVLEEASLVLPDGVSMTLGARLLGKKFPERLPGPLVMLEYCRHGINKDLKHFFYGGSDGVVEQLATKLRQRVRGIRIVGTFSPPFRSLTQEEERTVKNHIEQSKADVLWVGLGAPKQERWMAEHVGKINVPLMLGVGAAFDFHSGNRRWAPNWIRKAGGEWIYRMFTGGRRVFCRNAKYESLFTLIIFKQALLNLLSRRKR